MKKEAKILETNEKGYVDETYNRAMKFVKNFGKFHPGVSNIYVFTSVDKDGNITDEKYGMNLMTDYGFATIYKNGTSFAASDSVKLYVGTGTSDFRTTSQSLELQAFGGLAATNSNTSKAYNYPMYFSKGENDGEGLITLISRFVIAYYDYNITNYPGDYALTEYGIGTSPTALWTHSHVYDMRGSRASILKRDNERLFITVYMCMSLLEAVIESGWENDTNRYTLITRNDIMYNRMGWDTTPRIYKRGNRKIDLGGKPTPTQDTSQQNAYQNSIMAPRCVLYDNNADTYDSSTKILNCGYFDGFMLYYSGFLCVEPQFLSTPEDVELINYKSGDATKYSGFADKFGTNPSSGYSKEQYPQMTHFFNANAYLYDWKTGGWNNKLDIYNPDDKWYDETPAQSNGGLPIYYANNGIILTGYVYQNIHPSDSIMSISGGGSTVYATNKYWANTNADGGTTDPNKGWVWIRDYENIPANCRNARYWITNTNDDSLVFVRQSDCFQLLEKGTQSNGYVAYNEYEQKYYIAPIADNYAYGWYKRDNIVYVPATRRTHTIGSSGTTSSETMTYDKWMIVFNSANNTVKTVDCSDITQGVFNPTDTALPFTGNVNALSKTHRTESGTGIICIESLDNNIEETCVIDMRSGSMTVTMYPWKHACCIWGTNRVAYIAAGGLDANVHIYDFGTGSLVGDAIPMPDGLTDIEHLFGHTKYLWMTNGTTYGYVVDLTKNTDRDIRGFSYAGTYGRSALHNVKYTCIDDMFIIYNITECGSSEIPKAHFIVINNRDSSQPSPEPPMPLTDFNADISSSYIGGRIDIILRYVNVGTDTYGRQVGSVVMLINRGYSNGSSTPDGADCRVYDFGQYLHTGEVKSYVHSTSSNFGNLCMYGENIIHRYNKKIPLINYLPIKLTGKTDTINAMKYIKNITNKAWLFGYTNTPTWGDGTGTPGIPPGVPLAKTDSEGNITGWS